MAAAAATKARHGMNESIARLSTGIRAMYGGDAAGYSVGTVHSAEAKSYASSTRNIENGISYAQTGESVLLEVANLAQRIRELAIADDNAALLDSNQIAALDAEAALLGDAIDKILDNTKFNGVEILDSAASKSVAINYSGDASSVTSTVGPSQALTAMAGITDATGADTTADTFLGTVAAALGNIAADLTALKAFQGAASATSANLSAASARIMDTDYATETASLTKNSILNQAALSMAAQANNAQSAILSVLQ
jgi:flagellin|tara:strand:- start:213 stop:977 length:765 start_codon:yes stop_codon:yes gene_type:complete